MEKRISWFDSVNMPARIHKTNDEGETTVCGYKPLSKQLAGHFWKVTSNVPRKIKGESRYCRVCFSNGGKALPWFELGK